MSYTYSGNPNSSIIDETHYRLGNTDPSSPFATDEEVLLALADAHGNTYLAAAAVLETKAIQFALRPTMVRRGDRWTSYGDAAAAFRTHAAFLRQQASLQTATVYAGGLSQSEKQSARRDTDLPQPFARKDLHVQRAPTPAATTTLEREDA